jgi:hypothetical protein
MLNARMPHNHVEYWQEERDRLDPGAPFSPEKIAERDLFHDVIAIVLHDP